MLDGQVTRDVLTLPGDERLALYGAPLLRDETVVGIILVAAPLWPVEQTLARLQVVLASAVLGSVFLAGGIGWLLASAAMRPVDQITAVARAIGRSGDLSADCRHPVAATSLAACRSPSTSCWSAWTARWPSNASSSTTPPTSCGRR